MGCYVKRDTLGRIVGSRGCTHFPSCALFGRPELWQAHVTVEISHNDAEPGLPAEEFVGLFVQRIMLGHVHVTGDDVCLPFHVTVVIMFDVCSK